MPNSSLTKFNSFTKALAEKVHNFASDQLMVALTNVLPVAANAVLADITQVSYTNCSSRNISLASSDQTSGVYRLVLSDLTLTASGGSVGPFRYAVIYNNTATNKELIGFYDYGVSVTIFDGETFLLDFDAVNGVLTIT
jgi:hypothetical protein